MWRSLLIFSLIALFFSSCKKDDEFIINPVAPPEEHGFGWEDVVFDCTGITDSVYFHGYLNGKEFCYSDAGNGYHAIAEYHDTWVTTSPTFPPPDSSIIETYTRANLGFKPDVLKEAEETFKLIGPKKEIGIPKLTYYEDFVVGALPLNDSSFTIMLEAPFNFEGNSYNSVALSTDKGDQTGSTLLLKQVSIYLDDDGVSTYGEFEFEINCKLYDQYNNITYYGDITEGILKLKILL